MTTTSMPPASERSPIPRRCTKYLGRSDSGGRCRGTTVAASGSLALCAAHHRELQARAAEFAGDQLELEIETTQRTGR